MPTPTLDFLSGGKGVAICETATTENYLDLGVSMQVYNKDLYFKSENLTKNMTVTTATYGNFLYFRDSNDNDIGFINALAHTNNREGIRFYSKRNVNGNNKYNGLLLYIDSSGSQSVDFNSNDSKNAWLKALTPDVLYTGDSNGTIELSASAADYTHMKIYYRVFNDSNAYRSVKIYQPDGKNVNLFAGVAGNNNGYFWPAGRDIYINGTSISTRATNRYYSASTVTASSRTVSKTNSVYIVRVEAW